MASPRLTRAVERAVLAHPNRVRAVQATMVALYVALLVGPAAGGGARGGRRPPTHGIGVTRARLPRSDGVDHFREAAALVEN